MSSRRRSSSSIGEDQINDLVQKLQALLPDFHPRQTRTVPPSEILKDICNYIKNLQREADNLSDRLCQLLASMDATGADADTLRNLLQQQ